MDQVSWDRIGGELLEAIVGVLLAREFVDVDRVRPQQGDGGLDVIVKVGPQLFDVYQVKRFSETLTDDQKSKIRKSLKNAIATHNDKNIPVHIRNWYITLPYQAMLSERTWLTRAAKRLETPFPHDWKGLDFLDSLASKYPSVIDYYLRGGRERLESRIDALGDFRSLRQLAGLGEAEAGQLLEPADLTPALQGVFRGLNDDDPHYRYDFEVTETMPLPTSRPGLVMSSSVGTEGVCVSYHLIARYKNATDDRPISLNFELDSAAMSAEERAAWQTSMRYGDAVTVTSGASLSVDAPGGLGGHFSDVRVTLLPLDSAMVTATNGVRWAVLEEDDSIVAELDMNITKRSVGPAGGLRVVGGDYTETISFELRAQPSAGDQADLRDVSIQLAVRPVSELQGRYTKGVLPGLQFIAAASLGGRLAFGPRFGDIRTDLAIDIPKTDSDDLVLLQVLTDLDELGDHVGAAQKVPDLAALTHAQMRNLARTVAAGRGEPQKMNAMPVRIRCERTFAETLVETGPQPLVVPIRHRLDLGSESIELDHLAVYFEQGDASIVEDVEGSGSVLIEVVCADSSAMHLCLSDRQEERQSE
ncbi:hypothetical protein [Aeromicrobium sp. 9AM]|uniref:hypothetical protein n=1 Tax=Aeromicrobium sp. 9AM TaxID=2653126 RepID=UPI0012F35696|nr:hypothetical protein [Aeromicrobium sp. 9AM]VXC09664.1 hypothetical protein AERO9AM_50043 [Aeromicrobium sp. 9AM]